VLEVVTTVEDVLGLAVVGTLEGLVVATLDVLGLVETAADIVELVVGTDAVDDLVELVVGTDGLVEDLVELVDGMLVVEEIVVYGGKLTWLL